MRSDIVPGAKFPDYELTDHTATRRKLSELPGSDPLVLVLRAYRGFDAPRGSEVKAWLLAILRNCHSTALRQHQRGVLVPLPEEYETAAMPGLMASGPEPEGESIRRDEQLTLDGLIAALPEGYREVLVLHEIEEPSYREIAEATQLPIGTVMPRLAR